jgi:hypothetical protein
MLQVRDNFSSHESLSMCAGTLFKAKRDLKMYLAFELFFL